MTTVPESLLRNSRRDAFQRGQAMTEYVIVFPVMVVLIFGTLQFALLWQAKTQLNYAAFESARSGSLNNARRWALNAGLVRGLAPIHTHGNTRQWLRWARSKVWDEIDAGLVEIQVINPTEESFQRHGYYEDTDDGPVQVIPNDHLMYRDSTPQGTPSQSIQDANLLKIRVMYCAEMHVPFVNRMINSLLRLGVAVNTTTAGDNLGAGKLGEFTTSGGFFNTVPGSFEETCLAQHITTAQPSRRFIPIVAQAIIRMQSSPIFDPPAP